MPGKHDRENYPFVFIFQNQIKLSEVWEIPGETFLSHVASTMLHRLRGAVLTWGNHALWDLQEDCVISNGGGLIHLHPSHTLPPPDDSLNVPAGCFLFTPSHFASHIAAPSSFSLSCLSSSNNWYQLQRIHIKNLNSSNFFKNLHQRNTIWH